MNSRIDLTKYINMLTEINPIQLYGRVKQVIGLVIESIGPAVSIGDLCYIYQKDGNPISAEVVGFREEKVLLMPLGEMRGIAPGNLVVSNGQPLMIDVGDDLLGRVVDGLGRVKDAESLTCCQDKYPVVNKAPDPLRRRRISEPLVTGIRVIDTLLTCGKGQRMGIFSGSGVGKSVLLGMIARHSKADVNVIALIGERGREVKDFLETNLGAEGLKRSVVVVATSDQPALVRINGALVASSIAEYFRDRGRDVILMMDSVTRLAMAQREVGLAIGEPPTTKGYTPSVFSLLSRLLERSGMAERGSITGFYTVLVEGDDMDEPISDSVRSILDGHIILSRDLADVGHYPPVDVLKSISRLMIDIVSTEHLNAAYRMKDILAVYRKAEDLINIGAYVDGSNPQIDRAKKLIESVNTFLKQGITERAEYEQSILQMKRIVSEGYPEPEDSEKILKQGNVEHETVQI